MKGPAIIGITLFSLNSLLKLKCKIESNNIGVKGMQEIASGLKCLKNLKDLSLIIGKFNEINSEGAVGLG